MSKQNDDTSYPQDDNPPMEPLRCIYCGNVLGLFDPNSRANMKLRCSSCKKDYDITLREHIASLKSWIRKAPREGRGETPCSG